MEELTDEQRAILEFEKLWFKWPAVKDARVLRELGMSPVRYYQVLDHIIDQPAAEAFDAQTVRRLQRLREVRRQARSARLSGT